MVVKNGDESHGIPIRKKSPTEQNPALTLPETNSKRPWKCRPPGDLEIPDLETHPFLGANLLDSFQGGYLS